MLEETYSDLFDDDEDPEEAEKCKAEDNELGLENLDWSEMSTRDRDLLKNNTADVDMLLVDVKSDEAEICVDCEPCWEYKLGTTFVDIRAGL